MTIPRAWLLAVLALGAAGCTDYQVTLNDRPLYHPPELLAVKAVTDSQLVICLEQTISDGEITAYAQLQSLTCSYGGIQSLEGLQQFKELQQVDLSNNRLVAVALLSQLPALQAVDLSGNPGLECEHLGLIRRRLEQDIRMISPAHCQ